MIKKSVIFIDRDGVINKEMPEGEYVKRWNQFHFLPGVFKTLKTLKENGFLAIVVTNQRCVAKGVISEEDLKEIHNKMTTQIKQHGGNIDAIYFCPHDISNNCNCRKPKPGMILEAINDLKEQGVQIDFKNSYMVGNSETDILAGKNSGLITIKIGGYSTLSDLNEKTFLEAVRCILKRSSI